MMRWLWEWWRRRLGDPYAWREYWLRRSEHAASQARRWSERIVEMIGRGKSR